MQSSKGGGHVQARQGFRHRGSGEARPLGRGARASAIGCPAAFDAPVYCPPGHQRPLTVSNLTSASLARAVCGTTAPRPDLWRKRKAAVRRAASDPRSRTPLRPATAATPQPFGPADQLAQFSRDNLKTTTLVKRVSGTHARRTATAATKRVMQAPPDPEHPPLTGWSPARSLWPNGRVAASSTASPPARVVVVHRCATVTPGARRPRCRTRYWRCDRAAERRRGAGPRAAGGGARAPPYCACCRLRACRAVRVRQVVTWTGVTRCRPVTSEGLLWHTRATPRDGTYWTLRKQGPWFLVVQLRSGTCDEVQRYGWYRRAGAAATAVGP